MHWVVVDLIGIAVVVLFFWFVLHRKQHFDAPLLGLISVGLAFLGIGILRPPSIKYAGLELNALKEQATEKISTLTAVEKIISLRIRAMRSRNAFEQLRKLSEENIPQKDLASLSFEEVLDVYDGQRGKDVFEIDYDVGMGDGKIVKFSSLPVVEKFKQLTEGLRPNYITNLVDRIVETSDKTAAVDNAIGFLKKSDYLPGCMVAGITLERIFQGKKGMPLYYEFGKWIDLHNKGRLKP